MSTTIDTILKLSGHKNMKSFYKEFPDEASFMAKHGKAFAKAQRGAKIKKAQQGYTGKMSVPDLLAFGSPEQEAPLKLEPWMTNDSTFAIPDSAKGFMGKLGDVAPYLSSATDLVKGVSMIKGQQNAVKESELGRELAEIQSKAIQSRDVDEGRGREIGIQNLRDTMQIMNPESIHNPYGRGSNILAKKGAEIPKAQGGFDLSTILNSGGDQLLNSASNLFVNKGRGPDAGSTIGKGLGSAVGTYFGGPVGAAIGGAAGSIFGGLVDQSDVKIAKNEAATKRFTQDAMGSLFGRSIQNQYSSYVKSGGEIPYNSDGDLQILEGGRVKTIATNPALSVGGENERIGMLTGRSHDDNGILARYGGKKFEGEGGEPYIIDHKGDLNILGDRPFNSLLAKSTGDPVLASIADEYGKRKYKYILTDIADKTKKVQTRIDKNKNKLQESDLSTPLGMIGGKTLALIIDNDEKNNLTKLAEQTRTLVDFQNKTADLAESMGMDVKKFDKNIVAKSGAKIPKAQEGEVIRNPKTGELIEITAEDLGYKTGIGGGPVQYGEAPIIAHPASAAANAAKVAGTVSKIGRWGKIAPWVGGAGIAASVGSGLFNNDEPEYTPISSTGASGSSPSTPSIPVTPTNDRPYMELIKKYFPEDQWENAYNVMMAESGGDPDIPSTYNQRGTENSWGLFQINLMAHPNMRYKVLDPEENVKYAADLYKKEGWRPWKNTATKLGLSNGKSSTVRTAISPPRGIPVADKLYKDGPIEQVYMEEIPLADRQRTIPQVSERVPYKPTLAKMEPAKVPEDNKPDRVGQVMDFLSSISPYVKPRYDAPMDYRNIMGEMYAMSRGEKPVPTFSYHPLLQTPYGVSFEDRINEVDANVNKMSRMVGGDPSKLAMISSQAYQAKNQIKAEEFRTNQQLQGEIRSKNLATLNDAQLKNIELYGSQAEKQALAESKTFSDRVSAMQSMASKEMQHEAMINQYNVASGLHDYSYDKSGRAWYTGPLAKFNMEGSGTGYAVADPNSEWVWQRETDPVTGEEIQVRRRKKTKKEQEATSISAKNGMNIARAIKSL